MSFAVRLVLLVVVPLAAAVVGLEMYVSSMRTITSENAYVKANKVAVSADIAGRVTEVPASTHRRVQKGDMLFVLDSRPYEIVYSQLDAELNVVRHEILGFQAAYRVQSRELAMAGDDLDYFQREFERQRKLSKGGLVSQATIDESQHSMQMARRRISAAREKLAAAVSKLGGDPELAVESHPSYLKVVAMRDAALLDLERTVVRAPVSGVVSQVELQPGEYVEDGKPVFSIVEDRNIWVTANLKETELTHVSIGHAVRVRADAFPERNFAATVDSIAPATGAEFSLLPPQNASGNWVKVVQRIPVRITLDEDNARELLRVGMSVRVEIETGIEPDLPEPLEAVVAFVRAGQERLAVLSAARAQQAN